MRFSSKVVGGCRPRGGGQHSTGAGGAGHELPESIPLGAEGPDPATCWTPVQGGFTPG